MLILSPPLFYFIIYIQGLPYKPIIFIFPSNMYLFNFSYLFTKCFLFINQMKSKLGQLGILFWSSILNMVLPCKYTVSFLPSFLKTSGLAEGQTAVGEIIAWRAYQLDEKKKKNIAFLK